MLINLRIFVYCVKLAHTYPEGQKNTYPYSLYWILQQYCLCYEKSRGQHMLSSHPLRP